MGIMDQVIGAYRFANNLLRPTRTQTMRIYQLSTDVRGINVSDFTDVQVLGKVMFTKTKDNRIDEKLPAIEDKTEGLFDVDWVNWCNAGLGDFDNCKIPDDILKMKSSHRMVINGQEYKVNNIMLLDENSSTVSLSEGEYNVVRVIFMKMQKDTDSITR